MSAPTQWTPPPSVPADGWNNNDIAVRARTSFLWALGVLIGSAVASVALGSSMPGSTAPASSMPWSAVLGSTQSLGVLVSWLGFLAAVAVGIRAIAQGSVGAGRAAKLGGYRRGVALTGLLGGIGVVVLAPSAVLLTSIALLG